MAEASTTYYELKISRERKKRRERGKSKNRKKTRKEKAETCSIQRGLESCGERIYFADASRESHVAWERNDRLISVTRKSIARSRVLSPHGRSKREREEDAFREGRRSKKKNTSNARHVQRAGTRDAMKIFLEARKTDKLVT